MLRVNSSENVLFSKITAPQRVINIGIVANSSQTLASQAYQIISPLAHNLLTGMFWMLQLASSCAHTVGQTHPLPGLEDRQASRSLTDPLTLATAAFSCVVAVFPAHWAYCWLRDRPLKIYAIKLFMAAEAMSKAQAAEKEILNTYYDLASARMVVEGADLDSPYLIEFILPERKELVETTLRKTIKFSMSLYHILADNPTDEGISQCIERQRAFVRKHRVYYEKFAKPSAPLSQRPAPATVTSSPFWHELSRPEPSTEGVRKKNARKKPPPSVVVSPPVSLPQPDIPLEIAMHDAYIKQFNRMDHGQRDIVNNVIRSLQQRDYRGVVSHAVMGYDKLFLADLHNFSGHSGGRGNWRLLYARKNETLNLLNIVSPHQGNKYFKKW